ncbi:MAG: LamG domain-containing protein [Steroidobacteraceae bacterium]
MKTAIKNLGAAVLLATLAACGGGAPTKLNPTTTPPTVLDYTGPAPSTVDIQAFKINLWENIKASNRCGSCHNAGGQTPRFARNDDVNAAYADANGVVNLTQPDQSRMVLKVAGGHNCWLSSNSACGDILTTWIRNWAGSVATGGKTIQLVAPVDQSVGSAKSFPTDSTLFASTIYPILHDANKGNCARCHSSGAATPQSPFFASNDVNEAYAAARAKINLDNPAISRLVVRLRDESHNCWTSSCANDATTMLNSVTAFANGIPLQVVDPALVISKALTLYDGTVAAGGNRHDTNLVALYEFKTGTGSSVFDTSGVEPALNLSMSGDATWVGGWGINIKAGGKVQGTTTASKKLADKIKATGEYTFEIWAAPANVTQEDAFLMSYSGGTTARNVTLAQRAYQYEAFGRSSTTNANGIPGLLTKDTDRDAQASLQHVVLTFDPINGRRLYVNGNPTGDVDPRTGGSLADWDDAFAFVLGNETSNNRQWQGVIKLAAVHNRALTTVQIQQNFAAGVGERYFLLFNVSNLVNLPQSYIMFEGAQYDSYSYLFTNPTFISLDPAVVPGSIAVKGMRIGINGAEAHVGQAYATLNANIGSAYTASSGQVLANIGTIIGLEKGPTADMFFLTFEQIGSHLHASTDPTPVTQTPTDNPLLPDVGVRTFDQLNQSMANITGIPTTTAAVATTFQTLKQQLPAVPSIDAFLASHQTGIAQLAIKYCAALVDDVAKRTAFFPGLNTGGGSASAYFASQPNRDLVINPLLQKVVGTSLANQPQTADVQGELNSLITKLIVTPGSNIATVTKAACAATLGSGALTVQ